MGKYQISLNEQLYQDLLAAAESSGVTPEEWIAARLPKFPLSKDRKEQWQQLQKAFGTWDDDEALDQISSQTNASPDNNS